MADYPEKLQALLPQLESLRRRLAVRGWELLSGEPLKVTLCPKGYGYTGPEVAAALESGGIYPEFYDPDHVVLMVSPQNDPAELRRLEEPEGTENAFLQEEFKAERARLEGRLAEIWREKKRMDALLAGLEENEQEYIRLRFEKGYGIDYIGRRLYISRATVFRMHDRILEKLRQAEIETP